MKAIKTTVLGILSLQSLIATQAKAMNPMVEGLNQFEVDVQTSQLDVNRIIQKRLVGFDPKQAVETLTLLKQVGLDKFETDGSVSLDQSMIQNVMEAAAIDGIEVRILNLNNQTAKIKFAAHDPSKFDRNKIKEAVQLAKEFQMKCDMDGKSMY